MKKNKIIGIAIGCIAVVLIISYVQQFIEKKESLEANSTLVQEGNITSTEVPAEDNQTEEEIELTFEVVWKERIDAAMAPSYCPPVENQIYPENYYLGQLIDTHLHIAAIPDWSPGEEDSYEDWWPLLGKTVTMPEIACTLKNEGTKKAFAFFPVYPEIPEQLLEVVHRTIQQYPTQFIPFIMPPGPDDVPPTVEADVLRQMLSVYLGLFDGYGEIGLYERENREANDFPPDAPIFQRIYPVVREHKLLVYLHPGEGQEKNLERALQQNPEITFIVHGEEIEPYIGNIMNKYQNIYFTADDIFVAELYEEYVGESKVAFLHKLNTNWESLLTKAHRRYAVLIESHPDRFMWGTDRGDAAWNYDLDVGQALVKYARAFIGRLDPAVQEKFAYKNAERLIEMSGEDE